MQLPPDTNDLEATQTSNKIRDASIPQNHGMKKECLHKMESFYRITRNINTLGDLPHSNTSNTSLTSNLLGY